MTKVKIYDRNGWTLTSYGNGWGYKLECDGRSVWFQDDDAAYFHERIINEDDGVLVNNVEDRFSDYWEVIS